MSGIIIRDASSEDSPCVEALTSKYYHGIDNVSINDVAVAEKNGYVIAACVVIHNDFYELHSIAVVPSYRGMGLASSLFEYMLARDEDIEKMYVRTTYPDFFEKLGFRKLDISMKSNMWADCAVCDKLNRCRQSAMIFTLDQQ